MPENMGVKPRGAAELGGWPRLAAAGRQGELLVGQGMVFCKKKVLAGNQTAETNLENAREIYILPSPTMAAGVKISTGGPPWHPHP